MSVKNFIFFMFSLIIFSIFSIINIENISYLSFFSLFFLIIFFFSEVKEYKKKNIGILRGTFYLILIIRYGVIPLIKIYTGSPDIKNIGELSYEEKEIAYFLYFYEMISIYMVVKLFNFFNYKKNKKKYIKKNMKEQKYSKKLNVVFGIILLFFITILFLNKQEVVDNFHFIYTQKKLGEGTSEYLKIKSNYSLVVIEYFRIVIISLCTQFFFRKYKKTNNKYFKYFNYLLLGINISFISGYNRQSILIYIMITIGIIKWVYEDEKNFKLSLVFSFVLIMFATFIKMSNSSDDLLGYLNNFYISMINNLESYFGGLFNISKASELYDLMKINKNINSNEIFYNDTIRSMPFLSKYSDSLKSTKTFFNYTIYKHYIYGDQIVPMVVQSYIYFGIYLSSFLTIIYTFLLLVLDRCSLMNRKKVYRYIIFVYLGFPISLFLMTNHIIAIGSFITKIIFYIIYVHILRIFIKKEIKNVGDNYNDCL